MKAALSLADPLPADPEKHVVARYGAAGDLEDAADLAPRDPDGARLLLMNAVTRMLQYPFLRDGDYLPRGKDLYLQTRERDAETAYMVHALLAETKIEAQLRLAWQIADRTIGVRGFFEWE